MPVIKPYWAGSIICKTTGLRDLSITKPPATSDMEEVKDIGLRCLLKFVIEEALSRGGTSASFQAVGTLHSEKEKFKMSAIGAARIPAYAFRTQFRKSSGPPAREILIARSALATTYSLTDV